MIPETETQLQSSKAPKLQSFKAPKESVKTTRDHPDKGPDSREKSMELLKGKWGPEEAHQPLKQGMFEF